MGSTEDMRTIVALRARVGQKEGGVLPTLDVVTGYGDDPRRSLTERDHIYPWAHLAWRHQDEWSYECWAAFWETLLPQWTAPDGDNRSFPRERMERVVAKLQHQGMSTQEIADTLGLKRNTLYRAGVFAGANRFAAPPSQRDESNPYRFMGAPEPGQERFPVVDDGTIRQLALKPEAVLPRVYCVDAEPMPPLGAGFNLLRIDRVAAGASPATPIDLPMKAAALGRPETWLEL